MFFHVLWPKMFNFAADKIAKQPAEILVLFCRKLAQVVKLQAQDSYFNLLPVKRHVITFDDSCTHGRSMWIKRALAECVLLWHHVLYVFVETASFCVKFCNYKILDIQLDINENL